RHEPRAGVVGHSRLRPLVERGNERVLREVFGKPDVAYDAREAGDELRRFDAPNGVDGTMNVGRHAEQSGRLSRWPQARWRSQEAAGWTRRTFSHRSKSRGSPIRSAKAGKSVVGPRQRSSSISAKSGASVRSVARSLKTSASSRFSAPSTSAGNCSSGP